MDMGNRIGWNRPVGLECALPRETGQRQTGWKVPAFGVEFAVLAWKLTGSGAAHGRLRQPLERSPRLLLRGFLQLFFPEAHADIDWDRPCESLDKELQQIAPEAEIGRRYVDKLVKVWLKSGEEQWVLIHVEVQMSRRGRISLADVRLQLPHLRHV